STGVELVAVGIAWPTVCTVSTLVGAPSLCATITAPSVSGAWPSFVANAPTTTKATKAKAIFALRRNFCEGHNKTNSGCTTSVDDPTTPRGPSPAARDYAIAPPQILRLQRARELAFTRRQLTNRNATDPPSVKAPPSIEAERSPVIAVGCGVAVAVR